MPQRGVRWSVILHGAEPLGSGQEIHASAVRAVKYEFLEFLSSLLVEMVTRMDSRPGRWLSCEDFLTFPQFM
jgi:hypothetical protein